MSRMSVKGMLSIAFVTVGIVPLLLFAMAFLSVLRRHLDDDLSGTTKAALRAVSIQTSASLLEEPRKVLPTLLMTAGDSDDSAELQSFLRAAAIPRPEFQELVFVDSDGRVEAKYPDDGRGVGSVYVFHAPRTTGNVSFSAPFSLGEGRTAIEVAYSNEKRTVAGRLSLAGMSSKLLLAALSPTDRVGVVDESGRYVLSSDPSRVGSPEITPTDASKGTVLVMEDDGAYYASSVPIPGSRWRAVYLRSREIAEAPMHGFLLRIALLGAGSLVLSCFLTVFAGRYVSKPLAVLVSRIELVATGRYGERVGGEFAAEFRGIADSFNVMAESIERRDREIQRSGERYRLLFNSNRAPALFVDETDGSIRDANPAAKNFYGYDIADKVALTINDIDAMPGTPILERLAAASHGGGAFVPTRQKLRSGKIRDVELYVGPVEYEGRSYLHVVVFDVTERRIAEERTETALREKTQLLQEVHHRVKNNQQLVVSLLGMQADSCDSSEAKNALKAAQDRMYAMALAHELVYQSEDLASIDIGDLVARLAANFILSGNLPEKAVAVRVERIRIDLEGAVPFAIALNELLHDAARVVVANPEAGPIQVIVREDHGSTGREAHIVVECGPTAREDDASRRNDSFEFLLVQALTGQLSGKVSRTGGPNGSPHRVEIILPIPASDGGSPI